MQKLIVILGPTSSGKTDLSIKLALWLGKKQSRIKFGIKGVEIVSADSRQVYKGMNIGTGKITKTEMQGIPHHLLDIASPKRKFSVVQYQKLALKAIKKIQKKNKIPFLVGGTGFYIQAVVDGIVIPKIKPDWKLRKNLEKKTTDKLFEMLKEKDSRRAKNIDRRNRRRLIRALEIVIKTGKSVPVFKKGPPEFDILMLGLKKPQAELKKLIQKRLKKRLREGMIKEVENLRKSGVSFKRLEELGLEYRYVAYYLQEKITYSEMVEKLQKEIERFAKRQMTWFSAHGGSASGGKKDKRIKWIKNYKEAKKLVKKFLT